jgi:hypothetical protein
MLSLVHASTGKLGERFEVLQHVLKLTRLPRPVSREIHVHKAVVHLHRYTLPVEES